MPQDFRAVLILHDAQDLPYDEVAAIVGVPVGTVKSRLHRGRVALGRALGARGGETSGSSPGPTQAAADVDEPERERGHGSEPSDGTMSR